MWILIIKLNILYSIKIAYLGYPYFILRILTESKYNKKVGNVRKVEKVWGGGRQKG